MKITFVLMFLMSPAFVYSQDVATDGWRHFVRVKFESKYFERENTYFLVPVFDEKIKALQGTEVQVTGHYMPFDLPNEAIVVSKYPYSSCFFCGGAGPESVTEVKLKVKAPRMKVDQVITVKGKLRLNNTDVNHMNFILEEAELVKE